MLFDELSLVDFFASVDPPEVLDQYLVSLPGEAKQQMEGLHFENVTTQNGGTYAEDKLNLSLQWALGDFSVSYLAEYISAIEADTVFFGSDYIQEIDSFLYHDIAAQYSMWGVTFSAGITNITDEEPPWIDSAFNAKTDVSTYRLFGTGYYARLSYQFE